VQCSVSAASGCKKQHLLLYNYCSIYSIFHLTLFLPCCRGFKQDCPDGQLGKDKILEMYSMILPADNAIPNCFLFIPIVPCCRGFKQDCPDDQMVKDKILAEQNQTVFHLTLFCHVAEDSSRTVQTVNWIRTSFWRFIT
jgi:hypothetical protein